MAAQRSDRQRQTVTAALEDVTALRFDISST